MHLPEVPTGSLSTVLADCYFAQVRFFTGFLLLVSFTVAGCATAPPDIQVIGRPGIVLAPRPDGNCNARLYGERDALPAGCTTEVGDVFLGEEGNTTTSSCTWEALSKEAVRQTCLAGADLAQLVMSQYPRQSGGTCYQMRVRMLRCASAPETPR
jgi:hypothetical protein